jgi:hypothetical protein
MMLWCRVWDFAASTQNLGSEVVLMMRPRNSFTWLGSSEDLSQLTAQPRLARVERVVSWAQRASSWLCTIMIMSSMYARQQMPFHVRMFMVAFTNQVNIQGEALRPNGHAQNVYC